jgi:NAD(P)-dependent dehydrogenase (short-subunit alcohol dehydrogenase family)
VVPPAFIRSPVHDRPGGPAGSLAEEPGVDEETAPRRCVGLNRILADRLQAADEVAAMAALLASDRASFTPGADFAVDGGVTPIV